MVRVEGTAGQQLCVQHLLAGANGDLWHKASRKHEALGRPCIVKVKSNIKNRDHLLKHHMDITSFQLNAAADAVAGKAAAAAG